MTSGLCLNPQIHWITFHGSVDFGYILKYLMGGIQLPQEEKLFFDMMRLYFINFYDVKEIRRDFVHLNQGGLAKLAKDLDVERIGTVHQAGSDSLITAQVFFKIKELYRKRVPGKDVESKFNRWIYGLGDSTNEEAYIDEYKHLTQEYSLHNGKLININLILSPIQTSKSKPNDMMLSSTSTTASNSTTSSLNSLTGMVNSSPFFGVPHQNHASGNSYLPEEDFFFKQLNQPQFGYQHQMLSQPTFYPQNRNGAFVPASSYDSYYEQ